MLCIYSVINPKFQSKLRSPGPPAAGKFEGASAPTSKVSPTAALRLARCPGPRLRRGRARPPGPRSEPRTGERPSPRPRQIGDGGRRSRFWQNRGPSVTPERPRQIGDRPTGTGPSPRPRANRGPGSRPRPRPRRGRRGLGPVPVPGQIGDRGPVPVTVPGGTGTGVSAPSG